MNLFDSISDQPANLLPKDGNVRYFGPVILASAADHFYQELLETIEWKNDVAVMFGKRIVTKRKVAWYGEKPFSYTYSNATKFALPWTPLLIELKNIIEEKSNATYNSCLLNLYHDGSEGMAWHSDGEKDLAKDGTIGSVSFGAERKFAFKHKVSKEKVNILLGHGSLLTMAGTTQTHWLHRLPPTKLVKRARVNLTFRTIVGQTC